MAFKRALWHSGLTYEQTCETCKTVVKYTDHALDFRPWYPDGFVDCPKCKNHLRHNENYAIDGPKDNNIEVVDKAEQATATQGARANNCTNCGYKFAEEDNFCAVCGAKRK